MSGPSGRPRGSGPPASGAGRSGRTSTSAWTALRSDGGLAPPSITSAGFVTVDHRSLGSGLPAMLSPRTRTSYEIVCAIATSDGQNGESFIGRDRLGRHADAHGHEVLDGLVAAAVRRPARRGAARSRRAAAGASASTMNGGSYSTSFVIPGSRSPPRARAPRPTSDRARTRESARLLDERLEVLDLASDRVRRRVAAVASPAAVVRDDREVRGEEAGQGRGALRSLSAPPTITSGGPSPTVSNAIVVPSVEVTVFMSLPP